MASLAPTTPADIERLQAAVRSDREIAEQEVAQRLTDPQLDPLLRQELFIVQGSVHLENGEMAKALSLGRAVAAWGEAQGELLIQGRAQNMLGLINWKLGDLPQALEMFTAARQCADRISATRLELQATGNMGLIQVALKQWNEAERGYRFVLAAAERNKEARLISITTNNLSVILWERDGPTDEALSFARRALEAKLPMRDWASIAQSAISISGLLRDRHEYAEAHAALEAAATWVKQANAASPNFYYALNRAQLLVELDNPQRDDDAGFATFAEAVVIAHDSGMLEEEARAHEHTARARASRNEHLLAYTHLELYTKLREKYLTEQSSQRVEKMQKAFEIDRLERDHHTERTRREALETLNARLERTGRERDSLLRLIGHDLRTHVGGMIGLGELLRLDLPPGDDTWETANDLCSLGESTLALLQEIMDHGSALDGAFSAQDHFDLVAMLHDVKRRLEPLFVRKDQPLEFDTLAESVTVFSNRSGLGRIIENLLTNAAKFSPAGTTTTLRLAEVNGHWQIAVIDRGQGIPPEEATRLFQANQRLSVRPTGDESSTGLGLVLVHDIARIIGVTLAHEPTPGGGASFLVDFPPEPVATYQI